MMARTTTVLFLYSEKKKIKLLMKISHIITEMITLLRLLSKNKNSFVAYELVVLIVPTFSSRTCHRIQIQDVTQTSRGQRTTITYSIFIHYIHPFIHTYALTLISQNLRCRKFKNTEIFHHLHIHIYNSFLYIYIYSG